MIRVIITAQITLLSLLMTSCSSLQSPHYIGDKVEFQDSDIGKETAWRVDKDIYHVKITGSDKVVASLTRWNKESEEYIAETNEFILSKLEDHFFLNIKDEDFYTVLHISVSDDMIAFYDLDSDEISKHLESGKIEAEGKYTFLLKGSKAEIDKFLINHVKVLYDRGTFLPGELVSGDMPSI